MFRTQRHILYVITNKKVSMIQLTGKFYDHEARDSLCIDLDIWEYGTDHCGFSDRVCNI